MKFAGGDDGPVIFAPPPLTKIPSAVTHQGLSGGSSVYDIAPPTPAHLRFSQGGGGSRFPTPGVDDVEVRDVWAHNLENEVAKIHALLPRYYVVCIDTEFPGTVHGCNTPHYLRTPRESYAVVKRNVDELQLLQLGITLSSPSAGRSPVVWQFNFRGFDVSRDPHAPSSIAMLMAHGLDFSTLRTFGIEPAAFARAFYRSGLGCGRLAWAAFSGSYDFAYLAKMLGDGRRLPETLEGFMSQVESIFGPAVLDVKYIARFCGEGGGIRGGLEKVAATLGVQRSAGRAHNAGSDSLLTSDVLRAMMRRFFPNGGVFNHAGVIEGLVQRNT
ncbi:hypothetical protein ABZP36_012460 [Zizania latifolia]